MAGDPRCMLTVRVVSLARSDLAPHAAMLNPLIAVRRRER
jgi:hypothetical protein